MANSRLLHRRGSASILIMILIIAAVIGIISFVWTTSTPSVKLTPDSGPVAAQRKLAIELKAPRGVLKSLSVAAIQGDKPFILLVKEFPSGTHDSQESVTFAGAALKDGPFTLRVTARSAVLNISGRSLEKSYSFVYDNTPPMVAVLSTAHNIIRGGAGLVVYSLSKNVDRTGVIVADRFYPGYHQTGDFYACLFPFPYDMEPARFVPRVFAVDQAGNERLAGINFHLLLKAFSTDRLNLSDSFLEKISAEFKNRYPQAQTPLEVFLKANGELRLQNIKSLHEFGRQTSPTPLWQGIFMRMPNSAPLGGFAQTRVYLHNNKQVDQQTHLGFDLASVIHAPVPAANNGKVVLADELGIYGQCVIIDHGIGLQTLYGHLSRITVKAGESVVKGQTIGNTGATGMAAGDHLHYGVTVSGQEVNPVEWWDPSWIKNNITDKLELGKMNTPTAPGR